MAPASYKWGYGSGFGYSIDTKKSFDVVAGVTTGGELVVRLLQVDHMGTQHEIVAFNRSMAGVCGLQPFLQRTSYSRNTQQHSWTIDWSAFREVLHASMCSPLCHSTLCVFAVYSKCCNPMRYVSPMYVTAVTHRQSPGQGRAVERSRSNFIGDGQACTRGIHVVST